MASTQFPRMKPLVDKSLMIRKEWIAVFEQLVQTQPPSGSGFVIDGSLSESGAMILYSGLSANRPSSPPGNSFYFAKDTGEIFYSQSSSWLLLSQELTGDVTKPIGGKVTTLATVNSNPGSFGSDITIPVITVNSKGLVTASTDVPLVVPPQPVLAAGSSGDVQFNFGGTLGANANLNWDNTSEVLSVSTIKVPEIISDSSLEIQTNFSGTPNTILFSQTGEWQIDSDPGVLNQAILSNGATSAPEWKNVVTSIDISGGTTGLTTTGGPVTTTGTITIVGTIPPYYEEIFATAGQTVINTTVKTTAKSSTRSYLIVTLNGVTQREGITGAFTVTGTNQLTFSSALALNDEILIYSWTA